MSAAHQLTNVERITRFMCAGNATITLRSMRSGMRFTYKFKRLEGPESSEGTVYFVNLLRGPDNTTDFSYMGLLTARTYLAAPYPTRFGFRTTAKSAVGKDAQSSIALRWFLAQLDGGHSTRLLEQLEVWHEGVCGRCGRKLTVPESIELGIGPDCAEAMGL